MGSSVQISSLQCANAGGERRGFRKVPEGCGVGPGASCRGRFRKVLAEFREVVPEGLAARSGGGSAKVRKVLGGYARFRCRARCRLQVPEVSGRFWKVPLQGQVEVAGAGSG